MDFVTCKMSSPAKLCENKMVNKMIECKGYPVVVNKNRYLVFKSKEEYKDIKSLEKELFDLVKNVLVKGINEEVLEMEKGRICKYSPL